MNTSPVMALLPSSRLNRRRKDAFSLVEVVLALGICAFALVALFGLLPIGLKSFQDAMDTTTRSQIANQVIGDALLASYTTYIANPPTPQYFGDQGEPEPAAKARYTVALKVVPLGDPTLGSNNDPANPTYPLQTLQSPANIASNLSLTITAIGVNAATVSAYNTLLVKND